MAKKSDSQRTFSVAVVGLSGTEKEKGSAGVGKSCLCNRFTRPLADEYYVDHISVLSQSDFSGRVVNNDHFLYWGEVTKTSDEGTDFHFAVIEQTEFIDDSSFQPFKSGKTEPYMKRCTATKIQSAEKLMYICKNQLGIEKEYEQKVIPEGRMNVDGFVCVLDVSVIPNRSVERQVEYVVAILNNLMKTKKPIVLATSKNDEAHELYVKEAEKLVNRKEFKGSIPIVETSAHENVNVELAFIVLAQMIDRTKGRSKITPFAEAARARREVLDVATEAYQSLIRSQVNDYRSLWNSYSKKFAQNQDFVHFCELFGHDQAQKEFRRHIKKLKEEFILKKKQTYLEDLPEVLQDLLPDISSVDSGDWPSVQHHLKEHSGFADYFVESPDDLPWQESDLVDSADSRIPFDLLESPEAELCFRNHVNTLQADQKRLDMRQQFKNLLEETGYVTPGKCLSEVHVLLIGRECYEALSEVDRQDIYDVHQKEIIDKARQNFQEVLLEHADCFYRFTSIGPSGAITQEDINKITDVLQEDSRYKALDRLDQDRKLMLFRHLGFVHCPIREHCPAFPNCMDCLIERVVATKAHRPASWSRNSQWQMNTDNNQLNLVILGSDGLADELATEIRAQCEDDEYEMDNVLYSLDYRIIDGDVNLPQNSFRTSDFLPHGCFCVYSSTKTLEYVRESLEKTLLSNLEQEDRLPFQGLPIVILFAADPATNEKELLCLREDGQTLADNLQCPFIDITGEELSGSQQFNEIQLRQALRSLLESIQHRAGFLNIYHSLPEAAEPDIRIIMCMFCGDPYSVEHVLGPLLNHQCCFTSGERSIILETFLGDSKRRVEVIVSSYHGANAFREDLVHGFILVFSTKRKASLATLRAETRHRKAHQSARARKIAFSVNIPNLPIQILAVTESGGANAFFSSDLSHTLITEGNAIADRLQAHFMTATPTCQQKTAFYTPFFKEVWEKKPEIEQAFNMEEPVPVVGTGTLPSRDATVDRRTLPMHQVPPPPPHRRESYHIRPSSADGSADSESHYERLPTDGSQGDELDEPVSPSFIEDRPLSPSDDSDLYSNVYTQENGEHLIKPSQIKNRRSMHGGWVDDSIFLRDHRDDDWVDHEHFHSYTMGRRKVPPPTKPKPGGKSKDAVPLFSTNDSEYAYAIVQDALPGNKMHRMRTQRREEKALTDSDSEWSSLERRQRDMYTKVSRKPTPHKKVRKKRSIPVAPPRVPPLPYEGLSSHLATYASERMLAAHSLDPLDKVRSGSPSEGSDDGTDGDVVEHYKAARPKYKPKRSFKLKKKPHSYLGNTLQHQFSSQLTSDSDLFSPSLKKLEQSAFQSQQDDDSSFEVSSPKDPNSPILFGAVTKVRGDGEKTATRRKDKKSKEDEKLEKRRQKEEEKQKRLAEKEKERLEKEKKKQKKVGTLKSATSTQQAVQMLEDFAQSDDNPIPLFLEKCIMSIEEEGLDSEGIYRVPGNRAHVDLLFQKFDEDQNISIRDLDIPVNAIATALKDFFSKRLPHLLPQEVTTELIEVAKISDRSCRLLALRSLLKKLPVSNFEILKFVFQHFVRVAENCKLNSMDSKNLAICWWPTLLPIQFTDMGEFEQMRPLLEDSVQTMIDQFRFLFCGQEEVVMV